ncbi:MAG TPA: MgtC/SapB family protein [Candidatus Baltobacteraceae bacterium]|nr:MgtC/SapB family protein [Candidatus Baltobacteraceae bacterium]
MAFTFSPLIGIAGAAVLGGAIGLQRQAEAKPAGFRTHLLVAAASAAFTAMGQHLHDTRIPSYVVVGIGFLGAGAIVRRGIAPAGLTTAASIWMSAAVGLNLGYGSSFGLYVGLIATAITLIALGVSDSDLMAWLRIPRKHKVNVQCVTPEVSAARISQIFRDAGVRIDESDVSSVRMEEGVELTDLAYLVDLPHGRNLGGVIREIGALSGVRKVEAAEPPFFGAG